VNITFYDSAFNNTIPQLDVVLKDANGSVVCTNKTNVAGLVSCVLDGVSANVDIVIDDARFTTLTQQIQVTSDS